MNNWRCDNPHTFGDPVDCSNPHTTSSGKVRCTAERFSLYGSDDLRAKIETPSCRQYEPGYFLAIGPLNWHKIIDEDDDDENWADPESVGWSCHSHGNHNDDGVGEEDRQGGETGTGKEKRTMDVKGKGKGKPMKEGKGKGNCKGQGIGKQTPGGDDISRAVALQLQKEMYEADLDTEGEQERVYFEPEASPAMLISWDDDTDSTELDGNYDSVNDTDLDMCMEYDVESPDCIHFDCDVDMDSDCDDYTEDDEQEEDEDEEEDKHEEEDEDEDDGKEPCMIGQGEMVNSLADEVHSMEDNQPMVLPGKVRGWASIPRGHGHKPRSLPQ